MGFGMIPACAAGKQIACVGVAECVKMEIFKPFHFFFATWKRQVREKQKPAVMVLSMGRHTYILSLMINFVALMFAL